MLLSWSSHSWKKGFNLFPLLGYGSNIAHWNIQKLRNPSATNANGMFCNYKVAKVLKELFAFTHYEMFLCDTSVMRPNQLILICTDEGEDCFLITDRFQPLSWLSMPFCTSLSSCVQYFFTVSFHIITHNLVSELISFVFFVCMGYVGYQHLVNISCL